MTILWERSDLARKVLYLSECVQNVFVVEGMVAETRSTSERPIQKKWFNFGALAAEGLGLLLLRI